jgi:glycosyltransferase involved in cell wall biosynthesis
LARVLPQGLIAGKPVISYDVDGAREVVIPKQTGCLLSPRDVPGLVEAIVSLAADPARRERYGANGRKLCVERFRHQHMTHQLREIYAAVIASRRR